MSKKPAICLQYNIKTLQKVFCYQEYFSPYSAKDIKESPYFKEFSEKFKTLFDGAEEISLDFLSSEFWINADDEQILPNTANILMDAIYCVSSSLWDYSILLDDENRMFANAEFRISNPYYIGLYTELIKYQIDEIKFHISTLIYLQNSLDKENEYLIFSLLDELKKKYGLGVSTHYDSINKNFLKDCLCSVCSCKNFQSPVQSFSLEIDLKRFDRYISLLKKYRGLSGKADFINKCNCFCLMKEGNNYFFSLSGTNHYDNLGLQIQTDLTSYFRNSTFLFCKLGNDTLSYGYQGPNKQFVKFSSPVKFCNMSSLYSNQIGWQYGCCERKIFPYTHNFTESLHIYCKYKPCFKCIPAINDQKKQRSELIFFALVKDSKKLKSILIRRKKLLLKQSGIYTLYP